MHIDYEVVEMMVFFWEQVADRQKVQDEYMIKVAEMPALKPIYTDDFTPDSFRKVLSAISNRELMSGPTKMESKFWNLNMWILEDIEVMRAMIDKVKKLNLDDLKTDKNLFFIVAPDGFYIENGKDIAVNFFKIIVDYMDLEKATIDGKEFEEYIRGLF